LSLFFCNLVEDRTLINKQKWIIIIIIIIDENVSTLKKKTSDSTYLCCSNWRILNELAILKESNNLQHTMYVMFITNSMMICLILKKYETNFYLLKI